MKTAILLALALGAGACNLVNPSPRSESVAPEIPQPAKGAVVERDTSLAPAEAPGTVRVVEEPLRDVEGVSGGRAWLLELYQTARDENVELKRKLEATARESAESSQAQASLTAERDELAALRTELERRVAELESQSLELARRLAGSEVARLEAEKSELERAARGGRP